MEPVAVIPSKRSKLEKVTTSSCLFCSTKDDALSTASQTGIHTVQKAHTQRTLYRSILNYRDLLKLDVFRYVTNKYPVAQTVLYIIHNLIFSDYLKDATFIRLTER